MRHILILAAPLLVFAAPASAQQGGEAADSTAAPAPAPAAKEKKVCRTSQVTGRRISKRQCYTAAQWAEYDQTQAAAANKLINDVQGAGAKASLGSGSNGSLSTGALFGLGQ
jgi:primosomal protein N'